MPGGLFLSLEGIDGAGKSSQAARLCEWLRERGREVVACRDPGSTELGDAVRGILLHRHDLAIHRRSEMLLYMAARAQLVEEVIRPALLRGAVVVSDRYLLSNVAYQAYAGALNLADVWEVGRIATDGVQPDLTMVLDLDVATAYSRLDQQRGQRDRMESQGGEYLSQVRAGFLAEAARGGLPIVVIDGSGSVAEIQRNIRAAVEGRFASL